MHPGQRTVGRQVDRARASGRPQVLRDPRHRGLVVHVDPALPMLRPGPPERDEREPPLAEELDPLVPRHRLQDDDRVDLPGGDQLLVQRDLRRTLGRRRDVHAVPGHRCRLHQATEQTVQEPTQARVLLAERVVLEVERQPDHLAAAGRQRPGRVVRGVPELLDRGAHGPDRRLGHPVRRVQYVRHRHRRHPGPPGHIRDGRPPRLLLRQSSPLCQTRSIRATPATGTSIAHTSGGVVRPRYTSVPEQSDTTRSTGPGPASSMMIRLEAPPFTSTIDRSVSVTRTTGLVKRPPQFPHHSPDLRVPGIRPRRPWRCPLPGSFSCAPGAADIAVAAQRRYPKNAKVMIALSGGPGQVRRRRRLLRAEP